jgi:hypothetical protein
VILAGVLIAASGQGRRARRDGREEQPDGRRRTVAQPVPGVDR